MEKDLTYLVHDVVAQLFFTGGLLWLLLSISKLLFGYWSSFSVLLKMASEESNERVVKISIILATLIVTYNNGGIKWVMAIIAIGIVLAVLVMMLIYIKKRWFIIERS